MSRQMKATKCPTDELSLTNRAVVNERDFDLSKINGGCDGIFKVIAHIADKHPILLIDNPLINRHVEVRTTSNGRYVFTLCSHRSVDPGSIGFSAPQRKWAMLSLGQEIEVRPYGFNPNKDYLSGMVVELDFLAKKNTTTDPYDTEKMAAEFLMQFPSQAFTVGQELAFSFLDKKVLIARVKELEALDIAANGKSVKVNTGLTMPNTILCFEKAENSPLNLTGKLKGKQKFQSIISPDWNFEKMGIGGLGNEFSAIFRRAFASRVFPQELIQDLGLKHCRGLLLYGPPGTGKTLMARQIGKMLNAREPKIINGPQILDKYVGESEANIRKLFAEAEEEEKRMGPNSGLHIIIFDEIDAICRARGSVAGSTGVNDTIVNQLLSKIDGVDQLNNILLIGMTNRLDLIDDALLRPGRLEVQMEIGLPDKKGRVEILGIHTQQLRKHSKLASDVSIDNLSSLTNNFSGAELEGLVRAATSTAMYRLIKADSNVEIDPEATQKLQVSNKDFEHALEYDIKPAFGVKADELERYVSRGIVVWGQQVQDALDMVKDCVNEINTFEDLQLLTILLEGPPGCGKTALAVHAALNSGFPFIKICTPENMIGYHENAKVQAIKKIFDEAYRSSLSCIIVDDIEGLIDYVSIGPRFSNSVLQELRILVRKQPPAGRKLLIIATTSIKDVLEEMRMIDYFRKVLHVFNVSNSKDLRSCLDELNVFTPEELATVAKMTEGKRFSIGIKPLLDFAAMTKVVQSKHRVSKFLANLEVAGGMGLLGL